ncbi:acyl-CoA dehydrogenase family protein [Chloroflexota bacterium]
MDFELSEEHKMLREAVRDFAEKEIAPLVEEAEEKEEFPVAIIPKMGELGYLCANYPVDYGGGGMGLIGWCVVIEELSRVCLGIASGINGQSGSGSVILAHGTEEQKQKYIVPSTKGQMVGAFALSEPNAGSDAAAIEATAVKLDGKYVINGNKIYITNGTIFDFALVAAYTDKSLGAGRGVSIFIVEKGTPGFSFTKMKKFCIRSSPTAEFAFEDCAVSAENMVGEEGKGFSYMMENLDAGRVVLAASAIGLSQAAYEASLDYARQRVQFGQPIYKFQANSFKISRMAMEIEAARWFMYRAAWLYDQGARRFKEAAMVKLFASEVCQRVTAEAMQVHGGVALMSESPVQRYFRDSRRGTILDGTSEIQQVVISRAIGLR